MERPTWQKSTTAWSMRSRSGSSAMLRAELLFAALALSRPHSLQLNLHTPCNTVQLHAFLGALQYKVALVIAP